MNNMRFLLFGGDRHIPAGGAKDFIKAFETRQEAQARIGGLLAGDLDWVQIMDLETSKIVYQHTKRQSNFVAKQARQMLDSWDEGTNDVFEDD